MEEEHRVTRECRGTAKGVISSRYSEENNSLLQFTDAAKFAYAIEDYENFKNCSIVSTQPRLSVYDC